VYRIQNGPRWIDVMLSVLAAFFGVQSKRNHERDSMADSYWLYIIISLVLVLVFIAVIYLLVKLALAYL
jgi:heme/copper-type cytochrome/quinol oxidase subunit 2